MQVLWFILLIFMLSNWSKAAVDVEKTVAQVEYILQQNTQLPRLSRTEIIQLLNDIRAEDAKSKSSSTSQSHEDQTSFPNDVELDNEITNHPKSPPKHYEINSFIKSDNKDKPKVDTHVNFVEYTTKKNEPTLMVVLPYTPRDGSSLQELYTRPPRVEMVTEPSKPEKEAKRKFVLSKSTTPRTAYKELSGTLNKNAEHANKHKEYVELSKDLQGFLDFHGMKEQVGNPDHFLLPLEGFKPLPPVRPLDGSVELPENILLTYDLIAPSSEVKSNDTHSPNNNFLYEPLRPELPYELDSSSSELKKTVIPLDLPKSRITKAVEKPNYAPIDYDSIKVIPLNKGASPVTDDTEQAELENELRKRQTNSTDDALRITLSLSTSSNDTNTTVSDPITELSSETSKAASTEAITNSPPAVASDSAPADSDTGASIADLEDSFGGPVPSQPGDSELPPPKKNGFYWMLDWNSFLEVGDGDSKVNIRFEPKLGDPQMFLPVNVP